MFCVLLRCLDYCIDQSSTNKNIQVCLKTILTDQLATIIFDLNNLTLLQRVAQSFLR
ncbi:hypothetical protein A1OE_141 [Candidatus Endolissoclinum faulkneri L2]|uniref:Uncharacterized protein n=1 Tax=Candidatus Endolissoclinum faulkneri L2 TaxID=1193729 RepID=K7YFI5_9PROT|nr:hypothetical protein A1OE_141 [Candidatus Endolissoclinum faulkneri L2]